MVDLVECFEIGHGLVIPASVTCTENNNLLPVTRSVKHLRLAQTDLLLLLRRQMHIQKKVKRKASKPSDSWVSNARTVIASEQTCVRMIVIADIKMHRDRLAAMNPTNPISAFCACRPDHWYFETTQPGKIGWVVSQWFTFWSNKSNNHQIIIK